MAFIIPKITWPASAPVNTLNFTYPPIEKGAAGLNGDEIEDVRSDTRTVSGLRQTLWWRQDEYKRLTMKFVSISGDYANWRAFIDYAHQGGSFLYYPDAIDTSTYAEFWLEDSGGSNRSQTANVQSPTTWQPKYSFRDNDEFELVILKVPSGISAGVPATPSGSTVTVGPTPVTPPPPGSVVTVTPTPSGSPPVPPGGGATEDLIDWVTMATGIMGQPDRATHHLEGVNQSGTLTQYYSYLDLTGVTKVWQIKSHVGNPSDVILVDSAYLYHWITEFAPAWSNPRDFKRINRAPGYPTAEGVPVMPRNFAPGIVGSPSAVTINSPKPNPQNDFLSCTSQPSIELGDFQGVLSGLHSMNFGGSVGTQNYLLNTVYRGNFGGFKVRENFFYVKYWGFVRWESQSLIGGAWVTTAFAVHNTLVSGGGLSPNFPCGMSFAWWL